MKAVIFQSQGTFNWGWAVIDARSGNIVEGRIHADLMKHEAEAEAAECLARLRAADRRDPQFDGPNQLYC